MDALKSLRPGKKVYFASDFHLGAPDLDSSRLREKLIVKWLDEVSFDAEAIFLLGDIFDFWFEYKKAIPKGFIRFQGKLAELADKGIAIYLFTGNHDMWMFDYFPDELNIPILRKPIDLEINGVKLLVGHGDGLGPGDNNYKRLKKIFNNKYCQKAFSIIHPSLGIAIANKWSSSSRISSSENEEVYLADKEFLLMYCKKKEAEQHRDYYIFGHRHLPIDVAVGPNSQYINLGEWVSKPYYAVLEHKTVSLKSFEG